MRLTTRRIVSPLYVFLVSPSPAPRWAQALTDARLAVDDYSVELRLRSIEPPFDKVEAELREAIERERLFLAETAASAVRSADNSRKIACAFSSGARDPAKGEAAAREIARGGFDVEAVTLDVSDRRSIEALADRLGEVDVLILSLIHI